MLSACPGCGLELEPVDTPAHPYIGASPACWTLYGELLAREYGELNMPPEHKFTVDAYAAQHPGTDEPRARQSVAVHLIRLCLMLEYDADASYATRVMSRATNGSLSFPWFDPVTPLGTITVRDVLAESEPAAHIAAVRRWGEDIWAAYADRQELVRAWVVRLQAQAQPLGG